MNLTSPSQVKSWCIEHDFHPNKVLGQNFLIDQNALKAIVDAGLEGLSGGEGLKVLEVGPGLGVLTEELLKRDCRVTAIEKDPILSARLAQEAETRSESEGWWKNLHLITGDALDLLAAQVQSSASNDYSCMISNLPYQAGTRILLELVKARKLPQITVLVQTEVAERLAAKEGSKTRSLSGVWAQLDYEVEIIRKVSATCFWPRPAIGSTVVRLKRHTRNVALSERERKIFHSLTKQAFEHRRKQLGSIFKDLIQSTARAEELSNENWIELTKGLIG